MSTKTLGRYELVTEIGQGPVGGLFRGRSEDKDVLVRVFSRKSPLSEADAEALLEAARLAKGREHAAVATLLDVVEAGDRVGLVYEGDGEALTTLQKKTFSGRRDMPMPVVLRIMTEVCSALSFAHKEAENAGENLAFGGVTPDEIAVRPGGEACLLGLFTAARAGALSPLAGMPRRAAFQAPEHFRDEPLTARSDVFSLAALAWELCLNRPLFGSLNLAEVKRRVLGDVKRADAGRIGKDGVSKAVADVLERALKNKPEDRYASIDELRTALVDTGEPLASPAEVASFVELLLGKPAEKAPISTPKPSARVELKKPDISQKFELKKPEVSAKAQPKKPELGKAAEPQTPAPSDAREARDRIITQELSIDDIEFPSFDAATLKAAAPSKPPPPLIKRPGPSTPPPPPAKLPIKAEAKASKEDPEKSGVVSKPASSLGAPSSEVEVDLPSDDDWGEEPKAAAPAAAKDDVAAPKEAAEEAKTSEDDKEVAKVAEDEKAPSTPDVGSVPVPVVSEERPIVGADKEPAAAAEEPVSAPEKGPDAAAEAPIFGAAPSAVEASEEAADKAPLPIENKPLAPALPLVAPSAAAFSAPSAELPEAPPGDAKRTRLAVALAFVAVALIGLGVVLSGGSEEPTAPATVEPQATEVTKAPEPPPAAVTAPPAAPEPSAPTEPAAEPPPSATAPEPPPAEPVAANPAPAATPRPTAPSSPAAGGAAKPSTPAKTAPKPGSAKPGGTSKPKPGDKKYIPQGI